MIKKKEVAAVPAGLPPTFIFREPTFSFLVLESCTWLVCNLYRPQPDLCFLFLIIRVLFPIACLGSSRELLVAGVLLGNILNSPNGKTAEAIVAVRGIDTTRTEVQAVAVGG